MIKKILKWYIVSDLDLFIEKDTACRTLNRRIRYLEKENENLYFENIRLRNNQVPVANIIDPEDINFKNYISKHKIREKIEELKEKADEDNPDIYIKIDAYQELLEEK